MLSKLSVKLPLGEIVALRGAVAGSGVLTLMKLLAGAIFPISGTIVMPAHVRTLLVHAEPLLLEGTLWDNLTLGSPDADPTHVWQVAEQLGLSPSLLLKPETPVGLGGACLRLADRHVVCYTRALLADVQVLLLSKFGSGLSAEHRARAHAVLADWINFRGVFSEGSLSRLSRPVGHHTRLDARTIFLSADNAEGATGSLPTICTVCATLQSNGGGVITSCALRRCVDGREADALVSCGSSSSPGGSPTEGGKPKLNARDIFSNRTSDFMTRVLSLGSKRGEQDLTA